MNWSDLPGAPVNPQLASLFGGIASLVMLAAARFEPGIRRAFDRWRMTW